MPIEYIWAIVVGASIGWLIARDIQNRWMINSLLRCVKNHENSIRILGGLPKVYDEHGKEL